jgi:isoquinoline 1-oxidoreductase subunit alpha
MATTIKINGVDRTVDVDGDTPLLWVLRDVLGMTGTKFGCGMALCGACTVHIDGAATRSCITTIDSIGSSEITTVEAIGATAAGAKIQKAWLDREVVQCGYCQSGQIMSASALIASNPHPTDADIDDAMSGNICRCGTYVRIRAAIIGRSMLQPDLFQVHLQLFGDQHRDRGIAALAHLDIGHDQDDLPITSDADEGIKREAIGRFGVAVCDRQAQAQRPRPLRPAATCAGRGDRGSLSAPLFARLRGLFEKALRKSLAGRHPGNRQLQCDTRGVAATAPSRCDRENYARVRGSKALECRSGVVPRAKR